jgi:hypothetical protein
VVRGRTVLTSRLAQTENGSRSSHLAHRLALCRRERDWPATWPPQKKILPREEIARHTSPPEFISGGLMTCQLPQLFLESFRAKSLPRTCRSKSGFRMVRPRAEGFSWGGGGGGS